MENPYGIAALWAQSDGIIKSVALCLLIMSITSWSVIITKAIHLLKLKQALQGSVQLWHANNIKNGTKLIATSKGKATPFSKLLNDGLSAKAHHQKHKDALHGQLNLADWLTASLRTSIDDSRSELQKGMAILASVGATAPFIGLLGTVWGIYHALINIGISGQASIDKVAGPVGEALVMTAFGLAVAIPAVLGYNALTRGNKRIIDRLNHFGHEIHAYLIIGSAPTKNPQALKAIGD